MEKVSYNFDFFLPPPSHQSHVLLPRTWYTAVLLACTYGPSATKLHTGTMVLLSPAVQFFLSFSEPNVERPGNLIQTVWFFSSREDPAYRVCQASSMWRRKMYYNNFDYVLKCAWLNKNIYIYLFIYLFKKK